VTRGTQQEVAGHQFTGFGAHHSSYPCTYLTAAAALGITKSDVNSFIRRLDKVFVKKTPPTAGDTAAAMTVLTVSDKGVHSAENRSVACAVSDSHIHKQSDDDSSSHSDSAPVASAST